MRYISRKKIITDRNLTKPKKRCENLSNFALKKIRTNWLLENNWVSIKVDAEVCFTGIHESLQSHLISIKAMQFSPNG
jgi:hypothetical protein